MEPASQPRPQPSSSATQTGPAGCTLVELYPGYPGYRGNVTGVMSNWAGLGDWECLEVLEQRDRSFDRVREDRANQRAADSLGINGSPELWTWENWLQIEAERGLVPSCYTCFMLDPATSPIRTDVLPDVDDPRITTGFMNGTSGISTLSNLAGYQSANETRIIAEFYANEDYVLRALAYLTGGPTLNAAELQDEMLRWIRHPLAPADGVRNLPTFNEIVGFAIWQAGGYTHVPDSADPIDQASLMLFAFGAASITASPEAVSWHMSEMFRMVEAWLAGGAHQPLDSYMQQQPIWQEFR